MSATKPTKPTVKQLQKVIAERDQTIKELTRDLVIMAERLEHEESVVRVPKKLRVSDYNSLIDHLIENRPEPIFPKEVPAKMTSATLTDGFVKECNEGPKHEPVIIQMGEGGEA